MLQTKRSWPSSGTVAIELVRCSDNATFERSQCSSVFRTTLGTTTGSSRHCSWHTRRRRLFIETSTSQRPWVALAFCLQPSCIEPGINGAAKWKTPTLLNDEGFSLPETTIFMPSARKHGGTQASRRMGGEDGHERADPLLAIREQLSVGHWWGRGCSERDMPLLLSQLPV